VITTSYLGAKDCKAVEQLSKLSNTEMRTRGQGLVCQLKNGYRRYS